MSRKFVLLMILALVGCTKAPPENPAEQSLRLGREKRAAKIEEMTKIYPCYSDTVTYCKGLNGFMVWICLNKLDPMQLTSKCKQHLEERPKYVQSLEREFIEKCKTYFKGCPHTEGEEGHNRRFRRMCTWQKYKKLNAECRAAMDKFILETPAVWRPKGWTPPSEDAGAQESSES